jgi:hypothetical protein
LLSVARGFEKDNLGVLIMVISHTVESAEQSLLAGEVPDIISFGLGVEVGQSVELKTKNSLLGGMVGDRCFAVSWCRGGYALISNPNFNKKSQNNAKNNQNEKGDLIIENLIVSQGKYTQPLVAIALEGISVKNFELLSPLDAYVKFVSGKEKYFLGTQRDITRLLNRGFEFEFKPLSKFNDLFQYAVVTATEESKQYYAKAFLEYLLSEKIQKRLTEIGMFSCFYDIDYQEKEFLEMQKVKNFSTFSAFIDKNTLLEMQNLSKLAVQGDTITLNEIKNALV